MASEDRNATARYIAQELGLDDERAVAAALRLLIDDECTVPFVARYRKHATGSLQPEQLRAIHHLYIKGEVFEKRRAAIVAALEKKEVLTPTLRAQIANATDLGELEDIYAPFKRRTTKASTARERGLGEVADRLLLDSTVGDKEVNEAVLRAIRDFNVSEIEALEGIQHIIAENVFLDLSLKKLLRSDYERTAQLETKRHPQLKRDSGKFRIYYTFKRDCRSLNAHQILAINRGESESELKVKIVINKELMMTKLLNQFDVVIKQREKFARLKPNSIGTHLLIDGLTLGYKKSIHPSLSREIRSELNEMAEKQSIEVYKTNLKKLLLGRGIRGAKVAALDPGFKHGCKIAFIDESGKVLGFDVIYPLPPQNETEQYIPVLLNSFQLTNSSEKWLMELLEKFAIDVIAIGNGQGSRESETFVSNLIKKYSIRSKIIKNLRYCIVSETGASVYSASPLAAEELPNLDVSYRGAVSIARRLQDPLSELCKIPPESLGVGMYQHDVDQKKLEAVSAEIIDDCVNLVGVNLNTASISVLKYVSGLDARKAENIVHYRSKNGVFSSRNDLLKVGGIGPKTFQNCAGFLRIFDGRQPLDATAIHPESYTSAEKLIMHLFSNIRSESSLEASQLISECLKNNSIQRQALLKEIDKVSENPEVLVSKLGATREDIADHLTELKNGVGFDPRNLGDEVVLRSGALSISELKIGQTMVGTVRNVVDFGVFVDIGVGHDGLIHKSKVKSRGEFAEVGVGDVVSVQVDSVDLSRLRIGLTMLSDDSNKRNKAKVTAGNMAVKRNTAPNSHPDSHLREASSKFLSKSLEAVNIDRSKERAKKRDDERLLSRDEHASKGPDGSRAPKSTSVRSKRKRETQPLNDLEELARSKAHSEKKPRLTEKERERLEKEAKRTSTAIQLDLVEEERPKKRIRIDIDLADSDKI